MEYIHKLPFIAGAFMAIVIGILSYISNVDQKETYVRMAVFMVVFYIVGIFIRSTISRTMDEIEKKREKEKEEERRKEQEEMERLRQEEELSKRAQSEANKSSKIDFKVDEQFDENEKMIEEFSPLVIKDFLRSSEDK